MRIVILGAGALGRLFGAHLGRCGRQVIMVDRDRQVVDTLNNQGIGFMEQGTTDPDAVTRIAVEAVHHAGEIRSAEVVLLAVKSRDTLTAVREAAHLITPSSPVLPLQTGLGNIEAVSREIGRESVLGGFTFMAAAALGPGIVRQGGTGKTYIGEPYQQEITDRIKQLAAVLQDCGLACTPVHRIMGRLWCKVIVFSAINALSAVLQVTNGRLLESMESVTLMKRLVDEGEKVARARSVDLVFNNLYDLLFEACKRTDQNISSMLQDILNGQSTEIDAQCGALVRFGEEEGIATPTHQTMVELVRLMEKKAAGHFGGEGGI